MQRVTRIVQHVDTQPIKSSSAAKSIAVVEPSAGHPLNVTILAGGNSGLVCAALFEENTKGRIKTFMLTSRVKLWEHGRNPKVTFPNGAVQEGHIHKVSDDPAEVIPQSDIVLWTGPVNAMKEVFENIAPYLNPEKTAVGTIFAQGLCHLLASRVFGPKVRFFALRNIPWLCRTVTVAEHAEIVGEKASIGVMTINLSMDFVKNHLEPLFVVQKMGKWEPVMEQLPDFSPVVFNPANQIIHPARYWGLFRNWRGEPLKGADEPNEWLYRDMDEVAGNCLQVLDEELQMLKNLYHAATGALGCRDVIPLADRLIAQYGDQIADKSTLAKMVGTNKAYSMAKTPFLRTKLGVMPNPNHRVVLDDIGWGLCVLLSIAERLEEVSGVKTPMTMTKAMIEWHQQMMKKEFLINGKLRGRDCDGLVLLKSNEPLEYAALAPGQETSSWLASVEDQNDEERYGNP